jgi:hypothetical protein
MNTLGKRRKALRVQRRRVIGRRAARRRKASGYRITEQRMAKKKFIPSGDSDFAAMARNFATQVTQDPQRYHMRSEDAQAIMNAVTQFRDTLAVCSRRITRSMAATMQKDSAREETERLIRDAANLIRLNKQISAVDKIRVGMRERATRLRRRKCPQTRPTMRLAATVHGSFDRGGRHVIYFFDSYERINRAKPEGATRLELFVDLVPMGEPIPHFPGQRTGGWNWYLGSYSRSPIKVNYPKTTGRVQVVYWGRWANSTGETGPFSSALVTASEDFSYTAPALPAPSDGGAGADGFGQTVIITSARRELPDHVETMKTLGSAQVRLLAARPNKVPDAA